MKKKINKTKLFLNPFRLNENNLFELFVHFEKQNYSLFIETEDYSFENLDDFIKIYNNQVIRNFKIRFSKNDNEYVELKIVLFFLPILEYTLNNSEIKANMLFFNEILNNTRYYDLKFIKKILTPGSAIVILANTFIIGIYIILLNIYRPDIKVYVFRYIHYFLILHTLLYTVSINLSNIDLKGTKSSIVYNLKNIYDKILLYLIYPLIVGVVLELVKSYHKELKNFLDNYFK